MEATSIFIKYIPHFHSLYSLSYIIYLYGNPLGSCNDIFFCKFTFELIEINRFTFTQIVFISQERKKKHQLTVINEVIKLPHIWRMVYRSHRLNVNCV